MNDRKKRQRRGVENACIYPLTHPSVGKFLRVMITRNGMTFRKDFFEHRYGGYEAAFRLATTWRDQVILDNPARTRSDFCSILRSSNTSGIAGVFRRSREHVTRSGNVRKYEDWQALLHTADGRTCRKSFSVSRYGEDRARALAIAARLESLASLADSVFRPGAQPKVVSSQEHINKLQKDAQARKERRKTLLAERIRRKAEREKLALDRKARAEEENAKRLEGSTSRTGHPYIGRYDPSGPSAHWRVSLQVQGTRYRKSFADSVNGGEEKALAAAIAWRDEIFIQVKLPAETARLSARAASHDDSPDKVEGVAWRKESRPGASPFWIAYAPKQFGLARKSRKFSIAKYGSDRAYALAVEARKKFVEEAAARKTGLHLVARKLLLTLGSTAPAAVRTRQSSESSGQGGDESLSGNAHGRGKQDRPDAAASR